MRRAKVREIRNIHTKLLAEAKAIKDTGAKPPWVPPMRKMLRAYTRARSMQHPKLQSSRRQTRLYGQANRDQVQNA